MSIQVLCQILKTVYYPAGVAVAGVKRGAQRGTPPRAEAIAAHWSAPLGQPHLWGYPGRELPVGQSVGQSFRETELRLSHRRWLKRGALEQLQLKIFYSAKCKEFTLYLYLFY